MHTLDEAVTNALCREVMLPERLQALFREVQAGIAQEGHRTRQERVTLSRQPRDAETKLDRLYEALERGMVDQEDYFKRP